MANDLATTNLTGQLAFAERLAKSNLLPKQYQNNPANVLWALAYGESVGIHGMAAIMGVHNIEGKVTASSGLISALVRRAGHRLRVQGDNKQATCEIVRSDDPGFTFKAVWTIERAQSAGLTGKQVWKNFPAAMLKARAITECARDACQEALNGVAYTPEELGADYDADATPPQAVVQEQARWSDKERAAFCAELGRLGLKYEEVASWCESIQRPRPSVMPAERRAALLSMLGGEGRKVFDKWLAAQTPVEPVDVPFFEDDPQPTAPEADKPFPE